MEPAVITSTTIKDLGAELALIFPLVIQFSWDYSNNKFIAESYLFNLHALAETQEKALSNLKELMAGDYQNFLEDYPDKLTEDAVNLLRLYCAFMGKDLPVICKV